MNLIKADKEYLWHPFTQMADWAKDIPSPPLVIASAKGNYLYDQSGRRYIDGVSSLWVTLHGHRKPEIDRAVKRQLARVAHSTFLGLTHEPGILLAKELVRVAPEGLTRVFYSDNGSTAVEIALKMAYQYWRQKEPRSSRDRFLSLRNAYHGDTIGSVSVGGMDLFHAKFRPLLFKALHAPSPYCFRCPDRDRCRRQCLAAAERLLQKNRGRICAAVVEPMVQGAAGMLTMPAGWLKAFEKLCRKYGVLLICDEVATGFGRTGKMFAVEHEGVRPDFMCLAKGITGGYLPLAATLATEEVYRAFLGRQDEYKTFFHGHTYTANPLACAAGIASLQLFRTGRTLSRVKAAEAVFARELDGLSALPWVGEIRRIGLMTGIELVADRESRKDFPEVRMVGARVCAAARSHGLIIRPLGNVIVLMPPLSITAAQLARMVRTVKKCIKEICQNSCDLP